MAKPLSGKGFHCVYEDDDLIIVHKGPDVVSASDRAHPDALPCRVERALAARVGHPVRVFEVHRLDRNVSGLLAFAKNKPALDALVQQFRERFPHRRYIAIVEGRIGEPEGSIERNIDTRARHAKVVGRGRGLPAVTRYRVLRYGPRHTLVEVELETGRKHQIRAHFAAVGHPVLGDRDFGGQEEFGFDRRRIALHATALVLRHPSSGREISIDDPPPPGFNRPFAEYDRPSRSQRSRRSRRSRPARPR